MKITEGYMPYLGYKTYYRIAGECSGNKKPLILLHGGPGSTHNYFEVLDRLADEGRAIISYDQLGCGNSYVEGHSELWCSTIELHPHDSYYYIHHSTVCQQFFCFFYFFIFPLFLSLTSF